MGQCISRAAGPVVLALSLASAVPAWAQKPPARPDVGRQIEALAQAQDAVRQQLTELRQALDQLKEQIQTAANADGQQREARVAAEGAAKTAIDEIEQLARGLYVEVNGVKGDLALVREDVQGLASKLESSRFSSGLLIASVIALQIILILLAIRSRR